MSRQWLGGRAFAWFVTAARARVAPPAPPPPPPPGQGAPPQQRCSDRGGPIPTGGFLPVYTNANLDSFGDGSTYTVQLGLRQSNKLTIRSEGTGPQGATKVVDVRVEVRGLSGWGA